MKLRWGLMLIALNLGVLLTLVFIYPHLMISPGALHAEHAELQTDCFACHTPWRGVKATACTHCHQPADIGLRSSKGVTLAGPQRAGIKGSFHQHLLEQNCLACHSDHAGPKLTKRSTQTFSHDLLTLAVRQQCESCHRAPDNKLHQGITASCSQCHSAKAWTPATFEHDKLFVLDGDHQAPCSTCHVKQDFKQYTCYGCHEHTPANIRAEHEEEGIRDFKDCVACHRSASEEPRKNGRRQERD